MMTLSSLAHLTDHQLLARVKLCAHDECQATASLIRSLAELDGRRTYLGEGCSSLLVRETMPAFDSVQT
jgi:hypothetical protein